MKNLNHTFLKNILSNIADPVFVKDETYRFVLFNDAFCDLLGYSAEQLYGKRDDDFFPKPEVEVFLRKDKEVFATGIENINEEKLTDANGDQHILVTKKKLVIDAEGNKYLVGVIRDMTEQINLQNELLKSNRLLKNYANIASHDLRGPLISINNLSKLIIEDLKDDLSDKHNELLEFISSSASKLCSLIDRLLVFSKINSKKISLTKINFQHFITVLINTLINNRTNINFDIQLGLLPKYIYADKELLAILFNNLISNALKFIPPQKRPEVNISCIEENNTYKFSIKDNGIGIAEKNLTTIFEMFKRLHSNEDYIGNGIGLALCKQIVEQHNGKIWAESTVGKGSNFCFTISKKNLAIN